VMEMMDVMDDDWWLYMMDNLTAMMDVMVG
jgi:hypothetical protein